MTTDRNVCAGPFGAFYDFYIERPWLGRIVARAVWGIDLQPLYESINQVAEVAPGSTIVDVPSGGGVALRALRPEQDVRYFAGDISPQMLDRVRERAVARSLSQVEIEIADMTALPFPDATADLFLSYSGIHMISDQKQAVAEIARCLKPGGRLLGATILAGGSRRAAWLFSSGARRGHALPPRREDLTTWLEHAGLERVSVGPQPGFALFSAEKSPTR